MFEEKKINLEELKEKDVKELQEYIKKLQIAFSMIISTIENFKEELDTEFYIKFFDFYIDLQTLANKDKETILKGVELLQKVENDFQVDEKDEDLKELIDTSYKVFDAFDKEFKQTINDDYKDNFNNEEKEKIIRRVIDDTMLKILENHAQKKRIDEIELINIDNNALNALNTLKM